MLARSASIISANGAEPAERKPGSGCLRGSRSDLKRSGGVGQPLGVAVVAARVCAAVPVLPQQPAMKQPSVQYPARAQERTVDPVCSPCQHVQQQAGWVMHSSVKAATRVRMRGRVDVVWEAGVWWREPEQGRGPTPSVLAQAAYEGQSLVWDAGLWWREFKDQEVRGTCAILSHRRSTWGSPSARATLLMQ